LMKMNGIISLMKIGGRMSRCEVPISINEQPKEITTREDVKM